MSAPSRSRSSGTAGRATGTGPAVLRPATFLFGRLSYARKIVVLASVIALPLAIVGWGYISTQQDNITFGRQELAGVSYLKPLLSLDVAVDAAEHAVATGRPVSSLDPQLAAVAAVDARLGTSLGATASWQQARSAVQAAEAATGAAAQPAWQAAVTALGKLIGQVGDASNLTLDPALDSYYVMDAVVVRLPNLLNTMTAVVDQALVTGTAGVLTAPADVAGVTATVGGTRPDAAAFAADVNKAVDGTTDAGLKTLAGPATALGTLLDKATQGVLDQTAHTGKVDAAAARADYDALAAQIPPMITKLADTLEQLLATRVGGYLTTEYEVFVGGGLALLLVAYLVIGFFVSSTRALGQMVGALQALADGDLTGRVEVSTRDEVGQMAGTLNNAVEQLSAIVHGLTSSSDQVFGAVSELTTVNGQLRDAAEQTATQSAALRGAADAVSADVASLVGGAEEMAGAIGEISTGASQASQVAGEAAELAGATNDAINRLGNSSAEIGEVVKVITSIAEQTNLLALNATIEAARAGAAGRGFAVVAGEVKELARETANATKDITQRVLALREDSEGAVEAIRQITDVIGRVNEIQTTIAAAVEEQNATTAEMTRTLGAVATSSAEIARGAETVADAASQATQNAQVTGHAAEELGQTAGELRGYAGRFQVA